MMGRKLCSSAAVRKSGLGVRGRVRVRVRMHVLTYLLSSTCSSAAPCSMPKPKHGTIAKKR